MTTTADPFPEWLEPVAVKELRNGLRGRAFAWMFVLSHVVVGGTLTFVLAHWGDNGGTASRAVTAAFWTIAAVWLLVVAPFAAWNALGAEIKTGNFELLSFTTLTPRRIVEGKWLALHAQSLVLAVSWLPYLLLTYYTGETNLLLHVVAFSCVVAANAYVTAFMLLLSTCGNGPRFVVLFVGVPAVLICSGCVGLPIIGACASILSGAGAGAGFSMPRLTLLPSEPWVLALAGVAAPIPGTLALMEMIASRLHPWWQYPPDEPPRRQFRLIIIGICTVFFLLQPLSLAGYFASVVGAYALFIPVALTPTLARSTP
jgi:hypothetical protein